ncbi:MAG: phospholipase D-like domain-containing protein [Candidatus Saccharimonadaceae bacterium]
MYDEQSFYRAFEKDLYSARESVIIESPFITLRRIEELLPAVTKLRRRGVLVTVNTRNPIEHDEEYEMQALVAIEKLQELDAKVLCTVKYHRKLAIIDGMVAWHGSLNILSQNGSCEIMWRVALKGIADQLLEFIKLTKYIGREYTL